MAATPNMSRSPANGVLPLPSNLNFAQAAGLGVAYLTAWSAMVDVAKVQAGETVLILGTTGAVGSVAARIAHSRGARVIGTVRKESDIASAKNLPVDDWINLAATELPAGVRAVTNGRGADVVFDVVGGQMFEKCLASLALGGRQVAISSSPDPVVNFYHNESKLLGFDSLKLNFEEIAAILRLMIPGIEAGLFPPPLVETFSLDEGLRLYREVAASKIKTKPILVP